MRAYCSLICTRDCITRCLANIRCCCHTCNCRKWNRSENAEMNVQAESDASLHTKCHLSCVSIAAWLRFVLLLLFDLLQTAGFATLHFPLCLLCCAGLRFRTCCLYQSTSGMQMTKKTYDECEISCQKCCSGWWDCCVTLIVECMWKKKKKPDTTSAEASKCVLLCSLRFNQCAWAIVAFGLGVCLMGLHGLGCFWVICWVGDEGASVWWKWKPAAIKCCVSCNEVMHFLCSFVIPSVPHVLCPVIEHLSYLYLPWVDNHGRLGNKLQMCVWEGNHSSLLCHFTFCAVNERVAVSCLFLVMCGFWCRNIFAGFSAHTTW